MAVRELVPYAENEASLRKKGRGVGQITRRVRKRIRDLKDTLGAHENGIGLAAPQIDIDSRVVVVRLGGRTAEGRAKEPDPPIALMARRSARIIFASTA